MKYRASNISLLVYLLLGITHLLLSLLHLPGHAIVKCLLMPVLIIHVFLSRDRQRHPAGFTALLIISLLFSWAGDIFLLDKQATSFLAGLGSFALAHIFYIALLSMKINRSWKKRLPRLIPLLVYFAVMLYFLIPAITGHETHRDLLVPVIFYSVVLCSMGASALLRNTSCAWVWSGALLFILSDSLIAWNMFVSPVPAASFLIMLTYISAQALLVKGLLYTA